MSRQPSRSAARRVPGSSAGGTLVRDCQIMLIRVPAERPRRLFTIFLAPQSAPSYAGWMKRARPVTQAVISLAVWPLTITLSPVILVAGEPVNRYVMRRVRRSAAAAPAAEIGHGDRPARAVAVRLPAPASLILMVISNPLWIALTAPGRWVSDRFRRPPSMRADTAAR